MNSLPQKKKKEHVIFDQKRKKSKYKTTFLKLFIKKTIFLKCCNVYLKSNGLDKII